MTSPTVPRQRERTRPLGELGHFVHGQVAKLQAQFLREEPAAIATLAKLRRGVGKEVGELPDLWQATLDGLPEQASERDEPTFDERAAYTAITLYALHQQSRRDTGMHVPGERLGTAVAKLARATNEVAVRRRFEALGTADDFAEIVHHARGLITQLRGEKLGIDYGIFADELVKLQIPGRAAQVRLQWGRDFYRRPPKPQASADPTATDSEEEA